MRRLWAQGAQGYLLLALILCSVSIGRAQVSYTDYHHALGDSSTYTEVTGMNSSGQVVGFFGDSATVIHGFLLSGGGFARIDAPGLVGKSYPAGTRVTGINKSGQMVGWYRNSTGFAHGFLLSGGKFTTIDPPGGSEVNAAAINDSGQIVGSFYGTDQQQHGFLYSGGVYTTIDAPGGLAGFGTEIFAINASGQMVGDVVYGDANETVHGFLYSGGSFTIIEPAGSLESGVVGINASGQIIGSFSGSGNTGGSFLYSGGVYTTINFLGALRTSIAGINDAGQIVGYYQVGSPTTYGFLYSGGSYTKLDPPGAYYAFGQAINDSGQMAGEFYDPSITVHVFVASALVTLLDPVPSLLDGPAVTTDSGLLSRPSIARQVSGVSADGVAQIVVKIAAPVAGEQYTLTLLNDSNAQSNSPDEDGGLGVLGTSTFAQSQVLVTAEDTSNGPMAFAIYRAPVDFARPLTVDANDRVAKQRLVSIQVLDNVTATTTTAPITIVRPPVALIHGLWSAPSTWNEFLVSLNANNLFGIYRVDYQSSNFVQVPINVRSSLTQLTKFLEIFKSTRDVAAVQFDLVGHSMGGLISRYMVYDSRFHMDSNYEQGWIHKLITIDTPHAGSFFPLRLDASDAVCHYVFFSAGMAIDGATHDLEPQSDLLKMLYSLPLPPTHAIAGVMTPDQDSALSQVLDTVLKGLGATATAPPKVCGNVFPNAQFSFSGLYGEPNDIAVAQSSQVYGFSPGVTANVVQGVVHSHVPPLPWLIQFAAAPPGALDAASGNPSQVLDLLNTPPSSSAFKQGIQ